MFKEENQVKEFLLKWYSENARDLPWRSKYKKKLLNPYFVFVSEYMLQQTTVNTVKNKFREFVIKWPNLQKLAQTSEKKNIIILVWSWILF